jgi:hypothetical protein
MNERDNALLIGGEDERCAIVEVHTNRLVRESITHTILISVVDPRRDEDALLRQIYIVPRITEKQALRIRIEHRTERLRRRIESVDIACSGHRLAEAPPDDPVQPVSTRHGSGVRGFFCRKSLSRACVSDTV